jgi:hypothetical protein
MLTISQVLYNEPGKPGLGQGFKVKLIKQGFDSETNAEFIRFLRYARQFYTKVQSKPYVTLDAPNCEPNNLSS